MNRYMAAAAVCIAILLAVITAVIVTKNLWALLGLIAVVFVAVNTLEEKEPTKCPHCGREL